MALKPKFLPCRCLPRGRCTGRLVGARPAEHDAQPRHSGPGQEEQGLDRLYQPVRSIRQRSVAPAELSFSASRSIRQAAAKRRLTPEAHADLIAAIRDIPSVELHVPQMELLSKRDQMRLISQADVIIGVHGNGLTNEIWMKPGGAVIESECRLGSRRVTESPAD